MFRQLRRRIKSFWQRGRRGWADEDTWYLDTYLSKVIAESVTYLRDNSCGYPCSYVNKGYVDITGKWHSPCESCNCLQDYEKSLTEISDAFNEVLEADKVFDYKRSAEALDRGIKVLHENFFSLWD